MLRRQFHRLEFPTRHEPSQLFRARRLGVFSSSSTAPARASSARARRRQPSRHRRRRRPFPPRRVCRVALLPPSRSPPRRSLRRRHLFRRLNQLQPTTHSRLGVSRARAKRETRENKRALQTRFFKNQKITNQIKSGHQWVHKPAFVTRRPRPHICVSATRMCVFLPYTKNRTNQTMKFKPGPPRAAASSVLIDVLTMNCR